MTNKLRKAAQWLHRTSQREIKLTIIGRGGSLDELADDDGGHGIGGTFAQPRVSRSKGGTRPCWCSQNGLGDGCCDGSIHVAY
jgi:hypothetical protein